MIKESFSKLKQKSRLPVLGYAPFFLGYAPFFRFSNPCDPKYSSIMLYLLPFPRYHFWLTKISHKFCKMPADLKLGGACPAPIKNKKK